MTPKRKQRLMIVVGIALMSFVSVGLLVWASRDNLSLYYSPDDVQAGAAPLHKTIRVGGVVDEGSLNRGIETLAVDFTVSVGDATPVKIIYDGILPDLFREGQGIVAKGKLQDDNTFIADEILAKHDETYMPPEVADAIEKSSHSLTEK